MDEQYSVWKSVVSILWKILLFVFVMLILASHWFVDELIFHPSPSSYTQDHRYFGVETSTGNNIACRFLPNQSSRYLIIYSHGNAEDLGHIEGLLKGFRHTGMSVLAYDYPGYGLSGGEATEKSCYDALEAVVQFSKDQLGFTADKIILQGRSLGSGPAIEMCTREAFAGLILESPFISIFEVAVGIDWIPWDRFRNLKKITQIDEPTLVIHGSEDEVVPFSNGEVIFEALESPKLHYWVDSAGHNDLVSYLGDEYWALLGDFIRYLDVD